MFILKNALLQHAAWPRALLVAAALCGGVTSSERTTLSWRWIEASAQRPEPPRDTSPKRAPARELYYSEIRQH